MAEAEKMVEAMTEEKRAGEAKVVELTGKVDDLTAQLESTKADAAKRNAHTMAHFGGKLSDAEAKIKELESLSVDVKRGTDELGATRVEMTKLQSQLEETKRAAQTTYLESEAKIATLTAQVS